jgi:hypothetical protein
MWVVRDDGTPGLSVQLELAIHRKLPEHMHEAVREYLLAGVPVGDFMENVLANDLVGAFSRADDRNTAAMRQWASFLHNDLPGRGSGRWSCWGDRATVRRWVESRGIRGLMAAAPPEGRADGEDEGVVNIPA